MVHDQHCPGIKGKFQKLLLHKTGDTIQLKRSMTDIRVSEHSLQMNCELVFHPGL